MNLPIKLYFEVHLSFAAFFGFLAIGVLSGVFGYHVLGGLSFWRNGLLGMLGGFMTAAIFVLVARLAVGDANEAGWWLCGVVGALTAVYVHERRS